METQIIFEMSLSADEYAVLNLLIEELFFQKHAVDAITSYLRRCVLRTSLLSPLSSILSPPGWKRPTLVTSGLK